MFLELSHTRLDIFKSVRELVLESYKITKQFPPEEKFAMTQQIRRSSLSIILNVAEGCSRKSAIERKRFFEILRGSLIELDTAIDIAAALQYCQKEELSVLGEKIITSFKLLTGLINKGASNTHN